MTDENKVGYGRPPLATQFQKGQSGNPNGRPKKAKSFREEVFDEMSEMTRFNEGGRTYETTKARAIAKTLLQDALSGNLRAIRVLVSLCAHPTSDAGDPQEISSEDRELLEEHIEREVRRRINASDIEREISTQTEHEENPHGT